MWKLSVQKELRNLSLSQYRQYTIETNSVLEHFKNLRHLKVYNEIWTTICYLQSFNDICTSIATTTSERRYKWSFNRHTQHWDPFHRNYSDLTLCKLSSKFIFIKSEYLKFEMMQRRNENSNLLLMPFKCWWKNVLI